MPQLTDEARSHLGVIHSIDVFKVLEQIKAVRDQVELIDEFKEISKQEMDTLVNLLEKYRGILKKI